MRVISILILLFLQFNLFAQCSSVKIEYDPVAKRKSIISKKISIRGKGGQGSFDMRIIAKEKEILLWARVPSKKSSMIRENEKLIIGFEDGEFIELNAAGDQMSEYEVSSTRSFWWTENYYPVSKEILSMLSNKNTKGFRFYFSDLFKAFRLNKKSIKKLRETSACVSSEGDQK